MATHTYMYMPDSNIDITYTQTTNTQLRYMYIHGKYILCICTSWLSDILYNDYTTCRSLHACNNTHIHKLVFKRYVGKNVC